MKEIKDDINKWRDVHAPGLEESILWKWLYYPKQSTDSIQSLSNYQWHFSQTLNKKFYNLYGKEVKLSLFADDTILYIGNPYDLPENH